MENLPINRRFFAVATALTAATLAASEAWSQPKLEKTKIILAASSKSALTALPLTLAEQLGFFKAQGLDLEVVDYGSEARALQALVSGAADVMAGTYEQALSAPALALKCKAFVLQGRTPAVCLGVSPKVFTNFRGVRDLKGKKIGISELGSASHLLVKQLLSRAGLNEADVHLVPLGPSLLGLGTFRTSHLDAISHGDPLMTLLQQKNEVRVVADTRTLKGCREVFGGAMPWHCLVAPSDFLEKHPRTAQSITQVMVHSLKWLQTAGPGDLLKTVPEAYLLGDRALYLASFNQLRESISPTGLMPEDGPRTLSRLLASFDPAFKPDKLDLAATFSNEFVRRAQEGFKS